MSHLPVFTASSYASSKKPEPTQVRSQIDVEVKKEDVTNDLLNLLADQICRRLNLHADLPNLSWNIICWPTLASSFKAIKVLQIIQKNTLKKLWNKKPSHKSSFLATTFTTPKIFFNQETLRLFYSPQKLMTKLPFRLYNFNHFIAELCHDPKDRLNN